MDTIQKLQSAKDQLMSWSYNSYYEDQAEIAYPYFIGKAKAKQMVYYKEMYDDCRLDTKGEHFQSFIGHICGALNQFSIEEHNIIISALAINKAESMPGVGLMHLYQDDLAVWSESVKEVFQKLAK